ncbi:LLM class flavin-dependent oxidoreductase [Nocardia sp. NPDC058499]|uniref:LLM class flavin-dependent oxidoreductase n=1 Tax=Nocardia sp. NPDC058499 TaxID=3346530 RepID=UPI00365288DF
MELRLAKSLATIDVLSGGRGNVSIGVGHAEQEFAAMGVPFHERGAIADEILEALNTLWTAAPPEYHGKYLVQRFRRRYRVRTERVPGPVDRGLARPLSDDRNTRTVAEPPRSVGSEHEYLDYLCWFAEEVMPEV